MMRSLSAAVLMVSLVSLVAAEPKSHPLTGDNTKVTFGGSKKDGKHEGGFKTVTGTYVVEGTDPTTGKISVEIDCESMYSDNEKLTAHLKSPDFFEVKEYPRAKFVSTKITRGDKGYTVTGDLTLRGMTKPVTFPADITVTEGGVAMTSKFTIDRNVWGITYGKGKIDDAVLLSVTVKPKN